MRQCACRCHPRIGNLKERHRRLHRPPTTDLSRMPATRTTRTRAPANRPIRPLSSPTLPVTPLLPGGKASKEQAKANRIDVAKELKRAAWNAEIGRRKAAARRYRLRCSVCSSPLITAAQTQIL